MIYRCCKRILTLFSLENRTEILLLAPTCTCGSFPEKRETSWWLKLNGKIGRPPKGEQAIPNFLNVFHRFDFTSRKSTRTLINSRAQSIIESSSQIVEFPGSFAVLKSDIESMLPNDILLTVKFYYYPHLSLFVKSLENIWPTFTFTIVIFLVPQTLQTARVVIYFSTTHWFVLEIIF